MTARATARKSIADARGERRTVSMKPRRRILFVLTLAAILISIFAEIRVTIPEKLREGHEAHFAQVTTKFLSYLRDRRTLPAWERSSMAAKYFVTTTGTELSRKSPPNPAARIAPR